MKNLNNRTILQSTYICWALAIMSLFQQEGKKDVAGESVPPSVSWKKKVVQMLGMWVYGFMQHRWESSNRDAPLWNDCANHVRNKILPTFFSPSGYEVRKNYGGADIICYLPLDTPFNAIRFLHWCIRALRSLSNTNFGGTTAYTGSVVMCLLIV